MDNLINEVKKKKEFSGLPDSVVNRVLSDLEGELDDKTKMKAARARLRKYFGVFLTNKVVKPKNLEDYRLILKSHKSSSNRNYDSFYEELLGEKIFDNVIDFGCGANGFSFPFLKRLNEDINYLGVEASKVLVGNMNEFFVKNHYNAEAVWLDLLEEKKVGNLVKSVEGNKCIFCFQVIDALERLSENYGSKFLEMLLASMSKDDLLIVSFPLSNLSGTRELAAKRNWVVKFLEGKVKFREISMYDEKFLIIETL